MATAHSHKLKELSKRLGYEFNDLELITRAVTHSSAGDKSPSDRSNERLEFLGDRVLGLIIADMLLKTYRSSDEGALALRFNALVRKETCAEVARELDMGAALFLSGGEAQSGGRANQSILGDTCEAIIAAIYLDGGIEAARSFIESHWGTRLANLTTPPRDPKTALQEWAQARKLPAPVYRVINRTGPDHAPQFTCSVNIEGFDMTTGDGSAKRNAEQAAATIFLQTENIWETAS